MRVVFKKISQLLWTLFGVVTVVFFLFNILPGDPAQMMLDQNENSEQLATIKAKYGFDQPLWKQYLAYLNDLSPASVHNNEETSFFYLSNQKYQYKKCFEVGQLVFVFKVPYFRESFQKKGVLVSSIIANTLPNTFVLATASIILALFLGLLLGIFSALYKGRWFDHFTQLLSTLGMSVPSFFSAILAAWLFGFVWQNFTGLNMTGSLFELDDMGEAVRVQWKNLILPALTLGLRPVAVITQLMRNSLLEVLQQDYIRTAKAKGLSTSQLVLKHALRNALNPVITAVSGWFASMLAGAVFVEYIFGWNGLGKEIVEALNTLDVPVLMGAVLVISTIFITINIFVDLIYGWLDPKVAHQKT